MVQLRLLSEMSRSSPKLVTLLFKIVTGKAKVPMYGQACSGKPSKRMDCSPTPLMSLNTKGNMANVTTFPDLRISTDVSYDPATFIGTVVHLPVKVDS